MKQSYWLLGFVVVLVVLAGCKQVPKDVPAANIVEDEELNLDNNQLRIMIDKEIDPAKSTFEFEGYAPGKSHGGTFTEMSGIIIVGEDENIIGAKGTIQADSVDTGIAGLDKHLKNEDFFDVEKYPEIKFESHAIKDGTLTGVLDFHGVAKEVSFPVTLKEKTLSADFLLDTTEFNMKYVGVDKQVKITFSVTY